MASLVDDIAEVLIPADRLQARVRELARQVEADYRQSGVLLIGVLKGALMFMVDLARGLDLPVELDFMAISSYGNATESSGVVRILKDLDMSIEGRHVLIVEDIVDTGLTLHYMQDILKARFPRSLRTACLLSKPSRRQVDVKVDYIGFTIEDRFVVGYGLDYGEKYRNLPDIAILNE